MNWFNYGEFNLARMWTTFCYSVYWKLTLAMASLPNLENVSVEGRWNDVGFSGRLFLIFSLLIFASEKWNTNLHNKKSSMMSLVIFYLGFEKFGRYGTLSPFLPKSVRALTTMLLVISSNPAGAFKFFTLPKVFKT